MYLRLYFINGYLCLLGENFPLEKVCIGYCILKLYIVTACVVPPSIVFSYIGSFAEAMCPLFQNVEDHLDVYIYLLLF